VAAEHPGRFIPSYAPLQYTVSTVFSISRADLTSRSSREHASDVLLLLPLAGTVFSVLILALRALYFHAFREPPKQDTEQRTTLVQEQRSFDRLASQNGGVVGLRLMTARAIGSALLLGLSITSALQNSTTDTLVCWPPSQTTSSLSIHVSPLVKAA